MGAKNDLLLAPLPMSPRKGDLFDHGEDATQIAHIQM